MKNICNYNFWEKRLIFEVSSLEQVKTGLSIKELTEKNLQELKDQIKDSIKNRQLLKNEMEQAISQIMKDFHKIITTAKEMLANNSTESTIQTESRELIKMKIADDGTQTTEIEINGKWTEIPNLLEYLLKKQSGQNG